MTDKYLKVFEVSVRVVLNPVQLQEAHGMLHQSLVGMIETLPEPFSVVFEDARLATYRSADGFVKVGLLPDGKLEILP